jgi:Zn-dependent peptidase ImmA (M78 family)
MSLVICRLKRRWLKLLPKEVVIDGFTYLVKVTKEQPILGDKVCYGYIDYDFNEIKIVGNKYLSKECQQQVFWHELLHGITHHRKINLPKEDEEDIIDSLARGLHELFVGNDWKEFE